MLTERSPRIAAAHRLLRRSRRTEAGEFLAEGAPAVTEAVGYARERPGEVLELFVTESAAAKHTPLIRAAFAAGVEVTQVTERAAAALSDTVTPQGLVVRCTHPRTTVADVLSGSPDADRRSGRGQRSGQRGHRDQTGRRGRRRRGDRRR